ncbi:MAG: hypothetical protein GTO45_33865 [Candidatus Aminicenantes bacterium]|nr:hypothetical protein [Candidatus Aminicenantes bacterium]NIM83697.1 hypothetical protein [Candidatus Aminicenantes bacterium]NIN23122.1 hypothetical protein [Candidatus Aminicenantes bacterium]NIN46849.1 hypothetical protein [Candidatus Aminicenantes bacterium]NIN89771.1 hypothetical protein [Candidatus Aminicenantes bacterium]
MKKVISIFFIVILGIGTFSKGNHNQNTINENAFTTIALLKASGRLKIRKRAEHETYQVYFHIPIAFQEQVPIAIEIDCKPLIDYRFLHLTPPNVIISARLKQTSKASLNWTGWVLIKENTYADCPEFVPLTALNELSAEEKKWLQSTDCAQLSAPIVQEKADLVRGNTSNLIELANNTALYCTSIPYDFSHDPMAFDAVYTLTWGNSCTGHAHAGAALLRANGVPARSILNIPSWASAYMDMHWMIDYFVPGYGWINMETSLGENFYNPQETVVVHVSNPGDEFPVFFPVGIDGFWHTSEPELGIFNPYWGRAHHSSQETLITDSFEKIAEAIQLSKAMFDYYSRYWGVYFNRDQNNNIFRAYLKQDAALVDLQNGDLDSFLIHIREALDHYKEVAPEPMETIFFDDFENAGTGWIHGGIEDEWEMGSPLYGPPGAHSGQNCWGVDLDDTYNNNADCWLMSPGIDLRNTSCAFLSFWVWNWVEDQYSRIHDPLWLDLTIDGSQFYPICNYMGGVNDDPQIPDVGGWSRVVLDLSHYAGHVVRIRFRFQSNHSKVQAGSYVDDFHVYGRILEFEKKPIVIELNAFRKTERAWIIRKEYDEIELSINNPYQLKGLTYDIFIREPGQYYQLLREITENEIQGSRYTLLYPLPNRDIEFQYLAVARDANDKILAIACTKTI